MRIPTTKPAPTTPISRRLTTSISKDWDSAVSEVIPHIGSGSPSSGYVLKSFRLNGGNGLLGKGFLRASVVK